MGRSDRVGLVFDRRIVRRGPRPMPGRFRTRVITDGVTPSLQVDYKHSKIKQYPKLGRALRTATTINDTYDFAIGRGLHNLVALRQVGSCANRRLLDVQRISHDPMIGAQRLAEVSGPVIEDDGARPPGCASATPAPTRCWPACCAFDYSPTGSAGPSTARAAGPGAGRGRHQAQGA